MSSVDPGEVPGPPVLSGLPHPEALWEGPLYRTLSVRGPVCGTPGLFWLCAGSGERERTGPGSVWKCGGSCKGIH